MNNKFFWKMSFVWKISPKYFKMLFVWKISPKYFKIGNTLLQEIAQMNYRCYKLVLWGFTVEQNVKKKLQLPIENHFIQNFRQKSRVDVYKERSQVWLKFFFETYNLQL